MNTDRLSRAKTCSRLLRTLLDDTRQDAPDEPEAGAVVGLYAAAHQLDLRIGDLIHYVEHVAHVPDHTPHDGIDLFSYCEVCQMELDTHTTSAGYTAVKPCEKCMKLARGEAFEDGRNDALRKKEKEKKP